MTDPSAWPPPTGDPWRPPGAWQAPPPVPPEPHVLDEEVEAGLAVQAPWRRAAVAQPLIPIGVVVVLGTLIAVSGLPTGDTAGSVYTLFAGLASLAGTVLVARPLARAYGGWRQAFGFDLPRGSDRGTVLRWLGIQVGSRFALLIALTSISPSLSDNHGGNTEELAGLPVPALLLAGVAAVVVAPVAEELAFRGVLLRALMRRLRFWPAALVSSGVFAVLHAGGVTRLAAIPLLVVVIFLFGVLQCVLVRRTGRLGPAIAVHGLMNLIVLALGASAE